MEAEDEATDALRLLFFEEDSAKASHVFKMWEDLGLVSSSGLMDEANEKAGGGGGQGKSRSKAPYGPNHHEALSKERS